MTDRLDLNALAGALAAAEDPQAALPDPLPCAPLDLLIALHQEVTEACLADLAYAQRGAAVACAVAERFPRDPLLRAQAHWTQGNAVLYVPDYAQALEHYDQALGCYEHACRLSTAAPGRDIRVVHIPRVFCLSELGRYDEAQQAAQQAERWLEQHPHDYARLTLLLNCCQLAGGMGDYSRMVDLADATIALAAELESDARLAHGWINRSLACTYLGRFDEAAVAIERGIAAATAAEEPVTIARALLNRAHLLRCRGQLFMALTTLREAQRGLEQTPGEAAEIALDEAAIYEQLRQLPEAQRAAQFAAEQFAQQAMPTYSATAALRAISIAVQQAHVQTARRLLAMAKAQSQAARLPTLDAAIVLAEARLAISTAGERAARAARAKARRAVAALQSHGLLQEAAAGQLLVAALEAKLGAPESARAIYHSLLHDEDQQVRLAANAELGALLAPAEALPYLRQAAELAVEQRRALPMEELQARYSSETSPYHMRLAASHLALGQVEQAFACVSAAKSGPLLDLRAAAATLDSDTHTILEQSKADIVRWREQLDDHQRKAQYAAQQDQHLRAAYHARQAQQAARELRTCELGLTAAVRTLGDRDGQARVPEPREIQATLPAGMALLEYAVCDTELVCFLARADQPIVCRRLGGYEAIESLLDRWHLICQRLTNEPAHDAQRQIDMALAPLWNLLLGPWGDELAPYPQLLIAPYGHLYHVPWAALWNGEAHLGDMSTLTLTPTAALWAAARAPLAEPPGPPRLLGAAGSGPYHLPFLGIELQMIAQHLADAEVYPAATAADLRAAPTPQVLHIAAHGRSNPAAPLCSTIELCDGPFMLLEAHRLHLHGTRLVTLSACETSTRPHSGDMALALAGAFLCSGARAVVASLRAVGDRATAQLMERFYLHLAEGADPAAALRQAQQHIRAGHPLDWAAFQIWAGSPL
jgi:hypothetical protein